MKIEFSEFGSTEIPDYQYILCCEQVPRQLRVDSANELMTLLWRQ